MHHATTIGWPGVTAKVTCVVSSDETKSDKHAYAGERRIHGSNKTYHVTSLLPHTEHSLEPAFLALLTQDITYYEAGQSAMVETEF